MSFLPISPITPVSVPKLSGLGGVGVANGIGQLSGLSGANATDATDGESFGDLVTKAVDNLDASHARTDSLAMQAATGDLSAVHDYTVAATETQLMTQLVVEVRNRAVEAFNDIMRMQV